MKKITFKQLSGLDACPGQLSLFKKLFNKEVILTKEIVLLHFKLFEIEWAASRLLSAPARKEYDKVCAPAREEYDKACATAREEYDKVCAPAREEYDKVRALTFYSLYETGD